MMPNFQTIATFVIVAGATIFLVRRIYKSLKSSGPSSCDCGCSACDVAQGCEDSESRKTP